MKDQTTLERAFELARTGDYASASAIRRQLVAEGYANVFSQISGKTLTTQLRLIGDGARARRDGENP